MLQHSKIMTCLYDCFYISLKLNNIPNAIDVVTNALGFSLEANIKSRGWVLCGQSDIDYYHPRLNRGFRAAWHPLSFTEFQNRLHTLSENPFPLIIETDSTLVPYYPKGSLEIGMPHAFIIVSWDSSTHHAQVYDRLALDHSIQKDNQNLFSIHLSKLYPALKKKIFIAQLHATQPTTDWSDEIRHLLQQSVINMEKTVSRAQSAYQVFGLQAIHDFADTLIQFDPNYHDDVQSTWLMSYHLPSCVFQSVYGNRYLFKKILTRANEEGKFDSIITALNESLIAWGLLRKQFVACANREVSYAGLASTVETIFIKEEATVNIIKTFLK